MPCLEGHSQVSQPNDLPASLYCHLDLGVSLEMQLTQTLSRDSMQKTNQQTHHRMKNQSVCKQLNVSCEGRSHGMHDHLNYLKSNAESWQVGRTFIATLFLGSKAFYADPLEN